MSNLSVINLPPHSIAQQKLSQHKISARTIAQQNISPHLVETWLTLSRSSAPQLKHAKRKAIKQLSVYFARTEFAEVYLEKAKDNDIEVHLL